MIKEPKNPDNHPIRQTQKKEIKLWVKMEKTKKHNKG